MTNKKSRFTKPTLKRLFPKKVAAKPAHSSRPNRLPAQTNTGRPATKQKAKPDPDSVKQNRGSSILSRFPQRKSGIPDPAKRDRDKTGTKTASGKSSFRTSPMTHHPGKKPHSRLKRHGPRRPQINQKKKELPVPPIEKDVLRIIPLGGVEQVGINMTAIEYGDDIIIIDVGFIFPNEDTPGIDYLLPNTAYLEVEERKKKIRAIFITHGHYDHIGAIPYINHKIGNPPMYTRKFGSMIIEKRQQEFPDQPPLDMRVIEGTETIKAGIFTVKTFPISHTIPDSMGLRIQTPFGEIAFIEDVRVDNIDGIPVQEEIEQYKQFKNTESMLLTMDSTGIAKPGWSLSEVTVIKNIEKYIRDAKGRLIIAAFASQIERLVDMVKLAKKYNKYIVIEGRSMKTNMEIARLLGLFDASHFISLEEMEKYPPNKIIMILTGAQGEEFAALTRIANKTHRYMRLNNTDTVLISASIVPGNYWPITKLKDNLYRTPAKIITYLDSDIHASGHGNKEELRWIHQQIKYKFFMPIHGNHYMLKMHADMAIDELGVSPENVVVPDNGSLIEIYKDSKGELQIRKRKERAPHAILMVDGFEINGTQEVVIRDRKMLSEDGIFVLIAAINSQTGKLIKSPDIIARGFVYVRESQELFRQARIIIKNTVEEAAGGVNPIDFNYIKSLLTDNVSKFLFQQTAKRPLVIPVLLSV